MNFSVLQHKNFRVLWLGQAISQVGDAFYYLVFLFMVKKVTNSAALVGYVGALESLPYLLFGAYAGVVVDRMDRKWIMLASDLASSGILVLLAGVTFFYGKPPVWSLLLAPFALSCVRCFFMPAKSAAIPSLVPESLLSKANALSSGTQTMAGIASLAISASVLSLVYAFSSKDFYVSVMVLNACSFALSAWFVFLLPKLLPDRGGVIDSHPWQDFKDGLNYIKARHDLKVCTVLMSIFRLSLGPFFVVYLSANDQWFGGKPQTISWLELVFCLGMLLSTFVVGRFPSKRPLLWFANGLAVVGGTVLAMACTPYILGFVLWQFVAGLAIPPADIPFATYLQLSVSDGFRGRVNAVRDTISIGVMPIGMVLGGMLVDKAGVRATFAIMGVLPIAASLIALFDKRIRNAPMPSSDNETEGIEGTFELTQLSLRSSPEGWQNADLERGQDDKTPVCP